MSNVYLMLRRMLIVALLALCGVAAAQTSAPPKEPDKISSYTLPPDKLAKAVEYARARNILYFAGVAYGIVVLLGVLALRVAPRFRDWAESASGRRIVQAYIQFVLAGIILWILYAVIRKSPRRWWFYFWLVAIPIVVFLMFIAPVVIEPMFFKFEPLAAKQPALVAEIQKVVARGGLEIPPDRMFEMKASEKLNSLNAYVAGIGASRRVVVWDTTIQKMKPEQILFVFGHEMGHYVLNHIWILIGLMSIVIGVFLFLGYHAMHWAIGRWGDRWGIRAIDDWASLPVLMLAIAIFGFLSEPLVNSFGRTIEHNADVYGLEVIHGIVPDSPQAAAAFQILGEVGLSDPNPNPFIEFWRYDHPSVGSRVRFAAEYDPWSKGEPRKYLQ